MPDTGVRYFDSTMAGAPALSGTVGTLIGVLDACLKDGFGAATLNSLVVVGNVATGTVNAGHGFAMIGGAVGPVIRIAGATPGALNGDWRLASVPNSTTFTFATAGIADQTATGTITAQRAPAGWAKSYSGTNKAVYARSDPSATAMRLRVDDTGTTTAAVSGYESMTDVDTGSGAFAGSGASGYTLAYFVKSNAASSVARPWTLCADGRFFYLFVDHTGTAGAGFMHGFGDYVPHVSADAYACVLLSSHSASNNDMEQVNRTAMIGCCICRSYTQIGGYVAAGRCSHIATTNLGQGVVSYPGPADNAFHAAPVDLWESGTIPRGTLPGLWNPLHAQNTIPSETIIGAVPQLPGRVLLVRRFESSCCAALDIVGSWR